MRRARLINILVFAVALENARANPVPPPPVIYNQPGGVPQISAVTGRTSLAQSPLDLFQRAPLPTDDGANLPASTGPCVVGGFYAWTGSDGVFRVASDDSCVPGQAIHTVQPNPGFVLDVIRNMGLTGYGHGTFRMAKAATNMGHWTDGGASFVGTLASTAGSASTSLTFSVSEAGILSAGQVIQGTGLPLADTIASVSGSVVTLSNATTASIASGAETFTIYNGGIVPLLANPPYTADYSVLDAAAQATPIQCANYPDLVSGAYCPTQVFVDTLYEQESNGTLYNSEPTYGLLLATGTASITGTQKNGDTVEIGTIAGTGGTSLWGAELNVVVSGGGTLVPTQLAGGGTSTFDKMGEYVVPSVGGGSVSTVQTQTSVTCGTTGCETALTINTSAYLQTGVWDTDNDVGPLMRGIVLNSVPVSIYDQLALNKVIYYPSMSNTVSYTLISIDSHGASWQGSGAGLFEFFSTGKEIQDTGNVSSGDGMSHLNMVGSGGNWACPLSIKDSPSIFMIDQAGSNTVTCAVDNYSASSTVNSTFAASTGLSIGGGQGVVTYGRTLHVGDIEITEAITQAQWQEIQLALIYATHIYPQNSAALINIAGDSRNNTNGDLTNAEHAPNMVRRYMPDWTAVYNKGQSGEALCSETPTVIANKMAGVYDPSLQWEGIVIEDGGIDLGNLVAPATVEACAITAVNAARAYPVAGGAPHIIMESVIPGCATFIGAAAGTSTKAAYINQYMLWLYQYGFKPQSQGGLGLTPGWDQVSGEITNPLVSPGANISNTWSLFPSVAVASGSTTITFTASGNAQYISVGQNVAKGGGSIPGGDTITAITNNGTVIVATLASATTGTIQTASGIDVYTLAAAGSTSITLASSTLATQLTVGEQLLNDAPTNTTITAINGEVVTLSAGTTVQTGDSTVFVFGDFVSTNGSVSALNIQGSLLCGPGINDNNQAYTPSKYSTDSTHPSHVLDQFYAALWGQELAQLQASH